MLVGFELNRADIAKTRMQPGSVIERFDVVEDGGSGGCPASETLAVGQLVLEAAPERLDERVANPKGSRRYLLIPGDLASDKMVGTGQVEHCVRASGLSPQGYVALTKKQLPLQAKNGKMEGCSWHPITPSP